MKARKAASCADAAVHGEPTQLRRRARRGGECRRRTRPCRTASPICVRTGTLACLRGKAEEPIPAPDILHVPKQSVRGSDVRRGESRTRRTK